jgi:lipopolysaccharide/colanic/teichoic acid biosynthesis glycosyltransferase
MAQVHGRDENSFADEVKLDVYYIEHYSLWLDLMILIQTFWVILKRGIFGK